MHACALAYTITLCDLFLFLFFFYFTLFILEEEKISRDNINGLTWWFVDAWRLRRPSCFNNMTSNNNLRLNNNDVF